MTLEESWLGKPITKVGKVIVKGTGNVVNAVCGDGVMRDAYNKLGRIKN